MLTSFLWNLTSSLRLNFETNSLCTAGIQYTVHYSRGHLCFYKKYRSIQRVYIVSVDVCMDVCVLHLWVHSLASVWVKVALGGFIYGRAIMHRCQSHKQAKQGFWPDTVSRIQSTTTTTTAHYEIDQGLDFHCVFKCNVLSSSAQYLQNRLAYLSKRGVKYGIMTLMRWVQERRTPHRVWWGPRGWLSKTQARNLCKTFGT